MPDTAKTARFNAPLKDDGSFDVARMHPKTRAALTAALQSPGLAHELGLAPGAGDAKVRQSAMAAGLLAGNLCQVIGMAEAIFLDSRGVPRDIIAQVAPMTEEETAAVLDPLTAVLEKYLGGHISKWGDELALAVALTAITTAKFSKARELTARRGPRAVTTPIPIRADDAAASPGGADSPSRPITSAE